MGDGDRPRKPGVVVPLVTGRGAVPQPGTCETLPVLWREWWKGPGSRLTNPNSRKNYKRCEQLSATLPDRSLPRNIEEWTARLVDGAGMNPRTADMHRYILGGVFRWAHENGLTPVNPVSQSRRVRPPPAESHPIKNIIEVWPVLLSVAKDATEAALLGVFRFTGVRLEEALALMPEDILRSITPWNISVNKQRGNANCWTTKPPKGERQRGCRRIPVRPELRELLTPVLDGWHPVQLRFGTRHMPRTSGEVRFLFPYRGGDTEDLRARLGAVAPDHFGPGCGFHTFRHTIAYELYSIGVEVVTISEWLGHESVLTTENYLARMAGGKVRADKALDQLFEKMDGGVRAPPSPGQSSTPGDVLDNPPEGQ